MGSEWVSGKTRLTGCQKRQKRQWQHMRQNAPKWSENVPARVQFKQSASQCKIHLVKVQEDSKILQLQLRENEKQICGAIKMLYEGGAALCVLSSTLFDAPCAHVVNCDPAGAHALRADACSVQRGPTLAVPLKTQKKLHSLQKVVEGGRMRLGRRPLTLRCEEGVHGRLVVVAISAGLGICPGCILVRARSRGPSQRRAAAGRTCPWRCEPSTCRHTCAPSAAWGSATNRASVCKMRARGSLPVIGAPPCSAYAFRKSTWSSVCSGTSKLQTSLLLSSCAMFSVGPFLSL